jgi:tRNA-splicing ligase RtcB (3'-phosphate/5'-hydroxy nucleic acid ligase)
VASVLYEKQTMKSLINIKGNEVLIFAETFEYEAFEQVKKMCNFEAYQNAKIRIMPDAHAGKGCTVGTTMTVTDRITPNLVGVDIGCGMLTIVLKDAMIDFSKLDEIIKSKIPHGFDVHNKSRAKFDFTGLRCQKHVDLSRASLSIGSLGGGNHFIEVGRSESTGGLYLVIHSGSRKLGGDVCKYYQDLAFSNANEMGRIKDALIKRLKAEGRAGEIAEELKKVRKPATDKELACLSGQDFDDYMNDMKIVQGFAILNRATIAEIIMNEADLHESSRFETIHNYIDFKRMILRKGAVSAEKGETLLIPINMRDGSLLCIGKGNEDWNYSAPHGAGRLMSRSMAKKNLDMKDFVKSMKGIYTTSVGTETLDEAPQAYKSADEIKTAIVDTVDVIDVIKPLYNFKAH